MFLKNEKVVLLDEFLDKDSKLITPLSRSAYMNLINKNISNLQKIDIIDGNHKSLLMEIFTQENKKDSTKITVRYVWMLDGVKFNAYSNWDKENNDCPFHHDLPGLGINSEESINLENFNEFSKKIKNKEYIIHIKTKSNFRYLNIMRPAISAKEITEKK